jgi:uncharacterized membrane protein YdbT with pleckstrin-like domain
MEKISLQPNEKILHQEKPSKRLIRYWFFATIPLLILMAMFVLFPLSIAIIGSSLLGFMFLPFLFVPTFVILAFFTAFALENSYKNRYYWVTNKRIIYRRGTFGYKISSIPLNRVSDVIISKTFFENLAGIESVKIQTLAGQISGGRSGSEGDLAAVNNAEELQQLILNTVEKYGKSL